MRATTPPRCRYGARRVVALLLVLLVLSTLTSCSRDDADRTDQTTTSFNPELDAAAPADAIRWDVGLTAGNDRQRRALETMSRTGMIAEQADNIDPATAVIASNIGVVYGIPQLEALRTGAAQSLGAGGGTVVEQAIGRWLDPQAAFDTDALDALVEAADTDWVAASQVPMALAALCGSPEYRPDWLAQAGPLADGDDPHGYVVSHVALGIAIARERGCGSPALDAAVDEFARRAAQRVPVPFDPTDLAIEVMVVLELLDRGDLIEPSWVDGLIDSQRPNGSWAYRMSPDEPRRNETYYSDWHPTLLAVWFLGLHEWPERRGPFFR